MYSIRSMVCSPTTSFTTSGLSLNCSIISCAISCKGCFLILADLIHKPKIVRSDIASNWSCKRIFAKLRPRSGKDLNVFIVNVFCRQCPASFTSAGQLTPAYSGFWFAASYFLVFRVHTVHALPHYLYRI